MVYWSLLSIAFGCIIFLSFVSCFDCLYLLFFFFFKQKTAYEMRISDWSSDVCSSDLLAARLDCETGQPGLKVQRWYIGADGKPRSEERRVGKECVIRVDLGGRRIIKKKNKKSKRVIMHM